MNNIALFDSQPRTDAEYEAQIDRYIVELDRMNAEMAETQKRIDARHLEIEAALQALAESYKD